MDLKEAKINELKEFFKAKGISQYEIATRLKISQPAVNALLNGKPFGKKTAKIWAEEFGISSTWLLTGDGTITSKPQDMETSKDTQIGLINYMKKESEKLAAMLEKKDEQIQQRDRQIDELIAMLKQQMNK